MNVFRKLVWLLVLVVAQAHAAGPQPTKVTAYRAKRTATKPNIIFILADDLGYGELGCYGQKKIQTPNLDRLAAEGMRFTQAYAGSPVCAPSRCALMTGLHTGHALVRGNERLPLPPEDITVAKVLTNAGYTTVAIGKWGLGNEFTTGIPNRQGFNQWLGYLDQLHAHDYYPEFLWRNDTQLPLDANTDGKKGKYSHDLFAAAATNFVHFNPEKLFFMYLAYTLPHANNELYRDTKNGMQVPSDQPYSDRPWPQPEKNKAAMITLLDRDVGRLLDTLKAKDLEKDTVIFFASDNGPHKEGGVDPAFFEASGPLRGIKREVYEGGIRVPMIARWPGKIPAGVVSDQVWAFWDFLPTAAELAGVKPPENIDGISLLPTLLGQPQTNQHAALYWEFHEGGSKQAARLGDWKAVRLAPGQPLELYNLKTDLAEKTNVAAQNADVVTRMEDYLKTARTESTQWPLKGPPAKTP